MAGSSSSFCCWQCSFRSLNWRELTRHRFETHSNEPNFIEKCVFEGCSETFRRYSLFLLYLSHKHHGMDVESLAAIGHGSSVDLSLVEIEEAYMETCDIVSKGTVEIESYSFL